LKFQGAPQNHKKTKFQKKGPPANRKNGAPGNAKKRGQGLFFCITGGPENKKTNGKKEIKKKERGAPLPMQKSLPSPFFFSSY